MKQSNIMIARSLADALKYKVNIKLIFLIITLLLSYIQEVKSLILSSSEDLICKNLFCEKVTEPCICRIERVLSKINNKTIESIDLSNNKLESLPPSLANMINLKVLNLNNNQLRKIPDEILSKLNKLEELHLKNNPLDDNILEKFNEATKIYR